jgi:pimeloyl-ACP methyl ester carboxylesterase
MSDHDTFMDEQVRTLIQDYVDGRVSRRDFMRRATALGIAGAAASSLPGFMADVTAAQQTVAAATKLPLDVAEWSYMWVNVHRAETARGAFVGGQQMYVEYMIPSRVRHPFPIVLVHGGGGQGTDWMGTPDGRPGWFQHLVAEGYRVYVVDRPGHGRSPFHPDLHGGFPAQAATLENVSGRFTPPNAQAPDNGPYRTLHNQWPGSGEIGSPDLDQFVASQGGSYVQQNAGGPAGAAPAGRQTGPPVPANQQPAAPPNLAHMAWRAAGAELLDKIGPAIIVSHSAGGPFGLLVAEARPNLVRACVIIEGAGSGFAGGNRWGMSTIPVTYDPPVADPADIKTVRIDSPEPGVGGYFLQAEPARRLPNLKNTKVVFVTSEASFASPGNPGGVAFLKQAGVSAEELRLVTLGIHGNGHMMMVEKNNREVLQPIIDWINKNVTGQPPAVPSRRAANDSTAVKLASMGMFWVGTEHKRMPYGTILKGQMYVQYFEPAQIRHPLPVVLVHGGGGSSLHYFGVGGMSGWAHHYVQAGYKVYLIDRPGHGRAPYHPDALGEIGNQPLYTQILGDTLRAATGPNKQWLGTGDIGDPLIDQIMAGQNAAPRDNTLAQELWKTHGAELIDRVGPAIVQTHSAGGPFGWIVANERPSLVKAVISFEGGGNVAQMQLPNLRNMPIMFLVAANSGRNGQPTIDALTQFGAKAELINLKDRGILGNGHFAMLENNRKHVFEVIRGWIEQKFPAARSTARA